MPDDIEQINKLCQQLSSLRDEHPDASLEKNGAYHLLRIPRFRLPLNAWNKKSCYMTLAVPDDWPGTQIRHVYVEPDLVLNTGESALKWLSRNPMVTTVVFLDGWLHFNICTYLSFRKLVAGDSTIEANTFTYVLNAVGSLLNPSDFRSHLEMYAEALLSARSALEGTKRGLGEAFLQFELQSLAARSVYTDSLPKSQPSDSTVEHREEIGLAD